MLIVSSWCAFAYEGRTGLCRLLQMHPSSVYQIIYCILRGFVVLSTPPFNITDNDSIDTIRWLAVAAMIQGLLIDGGRGKGEEGVTAQQRWFRCSSTKWGNCSGWRTRCWCWGRCCGLIMVLTISRVAIELLVGLSFFSQHIPVNKSNRSLRQ